MARFSFNSLLFNGVGVLFYCTVLYLAVQGMGRLMVNTLKPLLTWNIMDSAILRPLCHLSLS